MPMINLSICDELIHKTYPAFWIKVLNMFWCCSCDCALFFLPTMHYICSNFNDPLDCQDNSNSEFLFHH
jgi:hypothetical protein